MKGQQPVSLIDVKVPDIGDFQDIPVIEVLVKPGDEVSPEDPLVTLESDKATMEVPSPAAGKVVEVLVNIGDKVSEGSAIIKLESAADVASAGGKAPKQSAAPPPPAPEVVTPPASQKTEPSTPPPSGGASSSGLPPPMDFGGVHASPSVRRLARELGVDLTQLKGTGEKGRVTKDDVKRALAGAPDAGMSGRGIPDIPAQDFSKYGEIETIPLTRLRKLSGPALHRAWLNIPHVTHTDEADITDLENYRKTIDAAAKEKGYRVTLLAFLMKAAVVALKAYPTFNASLSPTKDSLILKKYYHLGIAVDTPDGLVVPVIKDVDRKGIMELSQELSEVSARMRDGKITPADIQGATFSISSLGGIGGTNFTPIVNAPEVAILGVVRAAMKPVWDGAEFKPRLMLPLCVSYDHRVIDGALAARFTRKFADVLADVRQLVL
ncbi:Dihydrolipoyllysine-residue acetyltransferase component of pyruvate dehydrogenase complex [Candidatus Filomicrobium marinum]|uniref:Acetyltransferase component of pyruvate dehydrogenase complex n=2 Tax=Filomicrobium TaxID=119044 RepID=A0A0D6JFQ7_9HYPH|nr:dihydrolipoyllysine-residue acetyltransferase [Candidatus Filomicrobium marinum]MCV0370079.1 dihydrolipoyllysine-residue acetyltransferase [Filomicrobium sp.]CFX26671.1 Dihydrolipoyllysine-residue acetyltransferase component of pyruvate dehydrogenase complex [Candidatus Filomicrobium marinum]CPR19476.1 Dihydrolipoyllysine-residue acetyltransferase component of pyruvate dehydrogenase complex [Candidatus Filomicrobium marinum]SDO06278.1 pyruvate dehydrogenase E2 component (dihydrolipoamide ace